MLFRYEARRQDKTTESGEIEAQNRGHALVLLRERGLLVDALAEVKPGASGRPQAGWGQGPFYPWWPIRATSMALFFGQLGQLLSAGVTPHQSFSDLESRVGGRLRRVCREGATALAHGGTLSDHLSRYPRFFAPHVVAIMRAGETAGTLPESCREIVLQYEAEVGVRRQMALLRAYLAVNLVACVLVPSFPRMIEHIKMDASAGSGALTVATVMDTLRPGLQWYWSYATHRLLPFILGVWLFLKVSQVVLNLPALEGLRDWLLLYTPIVGAAARKAAVARFARTLELMLHAAVPPEKAIREAAAATGNVIVARRVAAPAAALRTGGHMNDAFRASGIFSSSDVSFLATAEQTGTLDDALSQLAVRLRDERASFLKLATRGGCVLGMLITAVCVLFAAVAGYTTLYNTIFKVFEGPDWQPP